MKPQKKKTLKIKESEIKGILYKIAKDKEVPEAVKVQACRVLLQYKDNSSSHDEDFAKKIEKALDI